MTSSNHRRNGYPGCGRTFTSSLALLIILLGALYVARAQRAAILDRIVAVVGEQAILASDVDEELRFAAFQPTREPAADNTPQRALDRVIARTLIDQQRALQPGLAEITQKDVEQSLADLRTLIPACVQYHCKTDAGWNAFLTAHGFTQSEVEAHIRERLAIVKFIDLRFGVATRVPNADVQKYYDQVLKPELLRGNAAVPEFSAVAARIREILRQQQVSTMVDQWLKSLRGEEHVRILDSAYGDSAHGEGVSGQ
jgi:peptidyl-prolyl cis-trans isomerase SurA